MLFNKNDYTDEAIKIHDNKLFYRAYKNIIYVDKPMEGCHKMNVYVPEDYCNAGSINGYTLNTAPIFMPNSVGGYLPGKIENPSESKAIRLALLHGYVVVSPAVRGRTLKDKNGKNYGKAPACITDYKAAVRFLHKFADEIPGDDMKIITNGTSAGGALSCLIGVTGNHPDYEEYLCEIGAADADDSVFAASCYCPITNLDCADMAYEWQFDGIYDYRKIKRTSVDNGRQNFTATNDETDDKRIRISKEESAMFPAYVNSLKLKNEKGDVLNLDKNGNGSFKEYINSVILSSAQKALDNGADLSDVKWINIQNSRAVSMDFAGYAKDITRMKTAPAFDDIAMTSPENHLFGDADNDFAHFTDYSASHSIANVKKASKKVIKLLNPMYYINDEKAEKAKYFRIRHGERDRDTSIAISAILNLKLKEIGCSVDYACPWDTPHSGDYDLKELFKWIDDSVSSS